MNYFSLVAFNISLILISPVVNVTTNNQLTDSFNDPKVELGSPIGYDCSNIKIERYFTEGLHEGIDISANEGCDIVAVADGKVKDFGWDPNGGGYYVKLDHDSGLTSEYLHGLDKPLVSEIGQNVKKGDLIMKMGCTGNCSDTHLHFSISQKGINVNPLTRINLETK